MICPTCSSPDLRGPIFGAAPGGRRTAAFVRCQHCRSVFDAYEIYGTARVRPGRS